MGPGSKVSGAVCNGKAKYYIICYNTKCYPVLPHSSMALLFLPEQNQINCWGRREGEISLSRVMKTAFMPGDQHKLVSVIRC